MNGRLLKYSGISYPTIQSKYISLAIGSAGDWANGYYDNMTYFKAEKFAQDPVILSYFTDGWCRVTNTEDYKTVWSRAYNLNPGEFTYRDWQFYSLTPTDRPTGSGEGRITRVEVGP